MNQRSDAADEQNGNHEPGDRDRARTGRLEVTRRALLHVARDSVSVVTPVASGDIIGQRPRRTLGCTLPMEDGMEHERLSPRVQEIERERSEALIAARTKELFDRLPPLLGFSFDEALCACEVELQRWPGHAWSRDVYDEVRTLITDFAAELAAEDPQGDELLRGRTFARHLH